MHVSAFTPQLYIQSLSLVLYSPISAEIITVRCSDLGNVHYVYLTIHSNTK